jgi:sulfur relay (sulfurtransferase) complex TusBCD TusD component (DsrE family)
MLLIFKFFDGVHIPNVIQNPSSRPMRALARSLQNFSDYEPPLLYCKSTSALRHSHGRGGGGETPLIQQCGSQ